MRRAERVGRRPLAGRLDILELRRLLHHVHQLLARLLSSRARFEEADFDELALAYMEVAVDHEQLLDALIQLTPLAKVEELLERLERLKDRRSRRGPAEQA